ncbi:hypothetical protein OKW38_002240 [Paraburkholderia sp. MM5496-R1]|uniref:hypothetical protein n=1 Tax=Paraburkholderia sp. MM5496-R1 TaxID=2991065 RepID=UPI003D1E54B8
MTTESPRLVELLKREDRFELFEKRLLVQGWIDGDELQAARSAMSRLPDEEEFSLLCDLHGWSPLADMRLVPAEFDCGMRGFVTFVYDGKRFNTLEAIKAELILRGFAIRSKYLPPSDLSS